MKKIMITVLLMLLLTGCSIFDRGNYEKNRSGFVISGNLIVNYHTNSIGEIDIFMIDTIFTFFEALEYTNFDASELDEHPTITSFVSVEELADCGITRDEPIPRFLRIGDATYFYNIRDNGYCTYDQYEFMENGYTELTIYDAEDVTPIEPLNVLRFKDTDFKINTFTDIVFIETIHYDSFLSQWVKEIVSVLPMSYTQVGDNFEDISDIMEEIHVLEVYILQNQSINLLSLREDYQDEDVNNIWSEDTVSVLGRDHEVVKKVRLKNAGDILDIINDTLSRLGMFQ